MKGKAKELMDQLQVVFAGHHAIDFLALQDEMRMMHVTTVTIWQDTTVLEKAQLQVTRPEMPIPNNYLMMVATKVMLSSERFP